jgi:hypothetical protein
VPVRLVEVPVRLVEVPAQLVEVTAQLIVAWSRSSALRWRASDDERSCV